MERGDNSSPVQIMITLDEAKAYLRVDSNFEDALIASLTVSAEALCANVARLSKDEWGAVAAYADGDEIPTIRGQEKTGSEILQMCEILHVSALYALSYMYEHREEADHHDLVLTLRNLLFAVREGVV